MRKSVMNKVKKEVLYKYIFILYQTESESQLFNDLEEYVERTGASIRSVFLNALREYLNNEKNR